MKIVNPVEVLSLWHNGGSSRTLPVPEIALKLGISQAKVRKHLRAFRAACKLLDQSRAGRLAAQQRRGSRPAIPSPATASEVPVHE